VILNLDAAACDRWWGRVYEESSTAGAREKKLALISGRFGDLPRLSRSGSHKYPASGVP
jgi:hypothetical protein